jgi:hypothetical protein
MLAAEDDRYEMRAGACPELGHGVANMRAHGLGRYMQFLCDLSGVLSKRDQGDHFTLALG